MYEEYIAAQKARLEKLLEEQKKIEKDIAEVTKLMIQCPYEVSPDD